MGFVRGPNLGSRAAASGGLGWRLRSRPRSRARRQGPSHGTSRDRYRRARELSTRPTAGAWPQGQEALALAPEHAAFQIDQRPSARSDHVREGAVEFLRTLRQVRRRTYAGVRDRERNGFENPRRKRFWETTLAPQGESVQNFVSPS